MHNDGDAADRLAHAIRDVIDEAVRVALQSLPQPGRPLPLSVPLDSPPCLPRLLYSAAEAKELLGIGNSTLYAKDEAEAQGGTPNGEEPYHMDPIQVRQIPRPGGISSVKCCGVQLNWCGVQVDYDLLPGDRHTASAQ